MAGDFCLFSWAPAGMLALVFCAFSYSALNCSATDEKKQTEKQIRDSVEKGSRINMEVNVSTHLPTKAEAEERIKTVTSVHARTQGGGTETEEETQKRGRAQIKITKDRQKMK